MDLKFNLTKGKIAVPNKKTMNLYQPDRRNDPKRIIFMGVSLIVVLLIFFGRFVVWETILESRNIRSEITSLQAELDMMNVKYDSYSEVRDRYYRYSKTYSKDEDQLVDRIAILSLIDEIGRQYAEISSTSITGNTVNIKVVTSDLEQISRLRIALESNEMVTDVTVYSATRSTGDVVASVSFECATVVEE